MMRYREAGFQWTGREACAAAFVRTNSGESLEEDIDALYGLYDWLDHNFGYKGWDVEGGIIGVRDSNNAMMFKMRWC
jgi:hypothetical protein